MKLSSLLFPGEYHSPFSARDIELTDLCTRPERVREGSLFVCLRGGHFDSHLLLGTVAKRGACGAIIEEGASPDMPQGFPCFTVPSTRRAYAYLCYRLAGCPGKRMKLLAVTGTNGKTSTAAILYHLLRHAGLRVAQIGTVSCHTEEKSYGPAAGEDPRHTMTTPDPDILYPMLSDMEADGVEYAVMEASSHALALEKLTPLHFAAGLFTNLSPEHLDFHATMENYLAAKASLFSLCDCAILNFDNEYADSLARRIPCPILRCGAVYHEQYNAEEIRSHGERGVSYTFSTPSLRLPIFLPIPGGFSVYNSMLALTCALHLGIPPQTAREALSTLPGVAGRMERLDLGEGADFTVIIDYAHTPAALENLLRTVREFRKEGQRILLLFGCGGDRDRSKRAPMGEIAEAYADRIFLTSDNSRSEEPAKIVRDILSGMRQKEKRRVILDRQQAIRYAVLTAQPGDILLLVGKGHEHYELAGGRERPLDEKAIVREALSLRRGQGVSNENPT